jgi:uncharacterized delta-60 repeat protein
VFPGGLRRVAPVVASVLALTCLLGAAGAQELGGRRKGYAVAPEAGPGGAHAVALQPDGRIVVGAGQGRGPEHQFRILLLRFTSDGRLDATLGGEGFVTTTVAETSDYLRAVAVQPDGKIVVAADSTRIPARGTTPNVFALVRYTSTGQPDATFGDGGTVLTQLSSNNLSYPAALTLQPDGKILVAGSTLTDHWWPIPQARYDFTVARYLPTGRLDTAFGSRGAAVHAVGTVSEDFASAMALQPDGRIVVAGSVHVRYPDDIGLLRLKADGGRDRSFGDGGRVVTQWKNGNSASSVAVQADGKILVTAAEIVLRYLPDGRLDPSFGEAGIMPKPIAFGRIVLQPDGKILLAGGARLARYLPDWRLDPSFGRAGIATIDPRLGLRAETAPVLQPDGKIVMAATRLADGHASVAVVRCNPDLTFGDPE